MSSNFSRIKDAFSLISTLLLFSETPPAKSLPNLEPPVPNLLAPVHWPLLSYSWNFNLPVAAW